VPAALSATIRGASKVMVVDRHPDRLRPAESIGAIPIDSKVDPEGHEHPNDTLNKLVTSVRWTGRIGSIGVFFIVSHELPLDQARVPSPPAARRRTCPRFCGRTVRG
jgi:threonine dehydrogenase-like Zn-dependent dehydrogenase